MSGVAAAESDSDELVRRLLISTGRMVLCMGAVVSIAFGVGLAMGFGGFIYGLWVGVPRLLLPTAIATVLYELTTARVARHRRPAPLVRHAIALAVVVLTTAVFFLFHLGIFPPTDSVGHFFWSVYWPWIRLALVGALLLPWITLRRSANATQ